ncbi:MAG: hypothetical protein HC803_06595 [Saprospiraceae bacterium]|nr:hypothetical protein [Saprospiraceae bacterium]
MYKYLKLLEVATHELGDSTKLVYVAGSYGLYYTNTKRIDKNLQSNLEALRLARKFNKDKPNIEGQILHNIASMFSKLGKFEECYEYLQLAYTAKPDGFSKGFTLLDMGNIHYKLYQDFDTVQVFYDEALQIFEKYNNLYGIAKVKQRKAAFFKHKKEYSKGLTFLKESEKIALDNDFGNLFISIFADLAAFHYDLKQYGKAIQYGNLAVGEIKEQTDYQFLTEGYSPLYKSYAALRQHDKAYEILNEYVALKDSVAASSYAEKVKELETQYQVKEKEKENQMLKAERETTKVKNKIRITIIIGLLFGLLLAVGWGFAVYRNNVVKQQYNKELQRKNEKLQQLDEAKTRFFANISHEYKTPLTLIINPIHRVLSRNKLDEEDKIFNKIGGEKQLTAF